jgi:hypothetical protein
VPSPKNYPPRIVLPTKATGWEKDTPTVARSAKA